MTPRPRAEPPRWRRIDGVVALCALLVVAVFSLRAWSFTGISNDDASRALIAWDFSRAPSLDPTRSSWLPVHTYTLGAIFTVWREPDAAPRAVSLVAAIACVVLAARLARDLGARRVATLAALAITVSWRWTLLPAASGAVPEMPCAAWFLGAIVLLQRGRPALAGACLSLACGHRYEAWFGGAALVANELVSRRPGAWRFALTASVMPLAWLAINHARAGDALDFVHRVEAFRRAEGPLPPWLTRALREPLLLVTELPLLALAASRGLVGAQLPDRDVTLTRRLAFAAFAMLALVTLGDIRGGGPTHHPARALTLLAWTLTPLAALGLSSITSRAWTLVAVTLSLFIGTPRAREIHDGVSRDAVCAGDAVRRARVTRSGPWFVEFARQDALWVEVRSGAPERALPDRAFGAPSADPSRSVTRSGAPVAAASSEATRESLRQSGYALSARCGAWSVWTR